VVEQWSKIAPPGWGPEGGSWPPAAAWGIGAGPGDAMAAHLCAAGRTLTAGACSGGGIRTAASGERPFRREQQGAPAAALASGGERSPRKSCRHEQQHENRGQRCPKDPGRRDRHGSAAAVHQHRRPVLGWRARPVTELVFGAAMRKARRLIPRCALPSRSPHAAPLPWYLAVSRRGKDHDETDQSAGSHPR
jgi:hypothetical protein